MYTRKHRRRIYYIRIHIIYFAFESKLSGCCARVVVKPAELYTYIDARPRAMARTRVFGIHVQIERDTASEREWYNVVVVGRRY